MWRHGDPLAWWGAVKGHDPHHSEALRTIGGIELAQPCCSDKGILTQDMKTIGVGYRFGCSEYHDDDELNSLLTIKLLFLSINFYLNWHKNHP